MKEWRNQIVGSCDEKDKSSALAKISFSLPYEITTIAELNVKRQLTANNFGSNMISEHDIEISHAI